MWKTSGESRWENDPLRNDMAFPWVFHIPMLVYWRLLLQKKWDS
jgi:hypothetical protein